MLFYAWDWHQKAITSAMSWSWFQLNLFNCFGFFVCLILTASILLKESNNNNKQSI